jgi:SulP family sulfate permease
MIEEETQIIKKKEETGFLSELSGSLGDLGTFLPHVLGAISVAGLNPSSIFSSFGLFYLFCGWFYSIPMAVQPMKAASAAVLVQKLSAGEVAAAGIIIGSILLLLGISGLIDKISKITHPGVIGGIQMGLGLSLAILGLKMISTDLFVGGFILVTMLPLLSSRKLPAAVFAVFAGTVLSFMLHPELSLPHVSFGFTWPHIIIPTLADFKNSFFLVALPQLPLTLANAVLVTSAVCNELYGSQAKRVTNKNLSLTMGIGNLITAPFGGYTMCHGSGGVSAHYRFGGRTKLTSYIIGTILILIGLLLGSDGAKLLSLVPESALGCLLFFSGLDLAQGARKTPDKESFFIVLTVAAITLAVNPATAFIGGLLLSKVLEKRIIKI